MKIFKLFIFFFILNQSIWGFILIDPSYRLANPEEVIVNVNESSCSPYISISELNSAIQEVLEKYWNTVQDSRLWLELGGNATEMSSGTILIDCGSLSVAGLTIKDNSLGASKITIDITSGYTFDGVVGLIAHEMGHSIGLHHSKDAASVMTYESHGWGAKPTYLSRDDKDGVTYLYPYEKEAGGLLGGCDITAAGNSPYSLWSYSSWLFSLFCHVLLFSFLRRGVSFLLPF